MVSDALISTRDGIVGSWVSPNAIPGQLPVEEPANMRNWAPRIREHVYYFEILSRLGFSVGPAASGGADPAVSVWHLATADAAGGPPTCVYQPLARLNRPSAAVFERQLGFMRAYADLRPDREAEILEQMDTMTPFHASIALIRPDTKPRTLALIDLVMDLGLFVVMRIKHALACRRPIEYSPQVQPIIPTPGHSTLPSGHATEGFAAALTLSALLHDAGHAHYRDRIYPTQLMRLASRIAINRTVAGLHFPIDSVAGALLGLTLADYFVARARPADAQNPSVKDYEAAHFDGTLLSDSAGPNGDAGRDFVWSEIYDVTSGRVKYPGRAPANERHPTVRPFNRSGGGDNRVSLAADTQSPILEWLWQGAVAEWR